MKMLISFRTPLMLITVTAVATADAASINRDAATNRVIEYDVSGRAPDEEVVPGGLETGLGLQLPAGAELVVGDYVQTTFSCEDEQHQKYGYYADVDNNCKVFHVCNPIRSPSSSPQHLQQYPDVNVLQYSFYCGNGTVFDQFSMTCAFEDDAIPCNNSPEFFYLNDNLGIEDAPLLTDNDIARKMALIEASRGQQSTQTEASPTQPPVDEVVSGSDESTLSTKAPFRAQTPSYGKRHSPPQAKRPLDSPQQKQTKPSPQQQQSQSKRPAHQPKYSTVSTVQPSTHTGKDQTTIANTSITTSIS
ncbi:uncharacterized protein LOC111265144 isoform X2 [Varroa jacobsoni]|uniref:Chitin-binding type-2 domain-containing protein n=1 Tax=Varroa destructor TaxID=109461 RepID=A0A7M7KGZ5_VARDE|nr:uncharacterized protein LOC111252666 isoform X2 [Varroa destructor]XP_022697297.1 uncharacterized protein LOC111265144 isoform X2 [Varroa jacobsoni]